MKQNLPHIYNSCWLNSLMILLSHTDVESKNDMIKKMLDFVKNETNELTRENIAKVMIDFYKEFNISHEFQNSRQMLNKFFNLLEFNNSQFEITDDYEKITLDKEIVILDYEQLRNMIEYNHEQIIQKKQTKENKIISTLDENINDFKFSHLNFIHYNDNTYVPCIFSLCLCAHYITLIFNNGEIIIYDDLKEPIIIKDQQQITRLLTRISNIEFIGYAKKINNNNNI